MGHKKSTIPLKHISSPQNALVKKVIELKTKASARRQEKRCIIEGFKEIDIAFESQIEIQTLLVNEENYEELEKYSFSSKCQDILVCSNEVMEKIAVRDTKQKAIAIAHTDYKSIDDLTLSSNPIVLILENIEKPGNLGALFRSCDAARVDAILCTSMQTDLYNPNVIRNSLGCVFSQNIVYCTNEEALDYCIKNHIKIYSTYLRTEHYYYDKNFAEPTALVMGSEGFGITDFWLQAPVELIKIPMLGKIDSMNVSNSASILLYEVVRQRMGV